MRRPTVLTLLLSAGITTALVTASARVRQERLEVSFEPPGRDEAAHIAGDTATLPNGRRATPAGRVIRTQSYAWGLAMAPGGRHAALVHPDSVEIVELEAPFSVRRIPPARSDKRPDLGTGTYMGSAFSPDGGRLYYGSADEGRILELDVASGRVARAFDLNSGGYADSFAGDLALSQDGLRLFVVDQFNYRFVTIDVPSGRVTRSVAVGRNPFAIALSPDRRSAWVSNVGMFEYPLIPGVTARTRRAKGLPFPASRPPPPGPEE